MGRIQYFLKKIINREIIMYLVFGALTTVVNYGVFVIGINISGTEKTLLVNLYAFIAATLFAFITNRLFVFQKQLVRVKIMIEEMIRFFAARIFSLGIEQLGLLLAIKYLDAEKIAVCGISTVYLWKIVLSFLAVILNYFASKYIVFRKRDEG